MSEKNLEKISLTVQDIRTLAAGMRPDCADARDCHGCPAKTAMTDRTGIASLSDVPAVRK